MHLPETANTISRQEVKRRNRTTCKVPRKEPQKTHIVYIFFGSLYIINEFEGVWEGAKTSKIERIYPEKALKVCL